MIEPPLTFKARALVMQDVHHYFGSILHFYGTYQETKELDSTFDGSTLFKALKLYERGLELFVQAADGFDLGLDQFSMMDELFSQDELVTTSRKLFELCQKFSEDNGIDSHSGNLK